jgi:hypothetical protein
MTARRLAGKRSAEPTFIVVGGGAIVGALGGSDTCRFQSIVMCPRARGQRSGSRWRLESRPLARLTAVDFSYVLLKACS